MRNIFLLSALSLIAAATQHVSADSYSITFDAELRDEPATGRVILFFITESGPRWNATRPIEGPFFDAPQPIASIAVENWQPGEPIVIDSSAVAFPKPLDELDFTQPVRVQAILDLASNPERSHGDGPGNLYSEAVAVEVSAHREDHYWIELTNKVEPRSQPPEIEHLKWVELRSEMLSAFYGREIHHRAGVALPPGYVAAHSEEPAGATGQRKAWPAIYMIPGYGGRAESAVVYANLFQAAARSGTMPMNIPDAVIIVLDPESPLGHHGFTDSPNHGPRSTALVQEFIPYIESQLDLATRPEARIVTGHSSGGWTSLWLQLNWPEVFGGCWSSAPDPIDFEAFQMTNLYQDQNLYAMSDGRPTPSHRELRHDGSEHVTMTVRDECGMEHAIHPTGGSGQQWDAWMAMFSPKDQRTGLPARMMDPLTGRIAPDVVEHWKQFDIARLVTSDWETYGPIVKERVRLAVGSKDSFYLERAVERFRAKVEERLEENRSDHSGYIMIAPGADHNTIKFVTQRRWNQEMRDHLRKHGLHD